MIIDVFETDKNSEPFLIDVDEVVMFSPTMSPSGNNVLCVTFKNGSQTTTNYKYEIIEKIKNTLKLKNKMELLSEINKI